MALAAYGGLEALTLKTAVGINRRLSLLETTLSSRYERSNLPHAQNVARLRSDFDSLNETTPSSRYALDTPIVARSRSDFDSRSLITEGTDRLSCASNFAEWHVTRRVSAMSVVSIY